MSVRIGIITDAHANLPATEAALRELDRRNCDEIVHTGDAIGIGPHPREVLDLLLARPNMHLLMGNHDELFVQGLPETRPEWMRESEWVHQQWVHTRLPDAMREVVSEWPYEHTVVTSGGEIRFRHYFPSPTGGPRAETVLQPTPDDLDALVDAPAPKLYFYGHHHPKSDLQGASRYVNPGALGCPQTEPITARFAVLTIEPDGSHSAELGEVDYDPTQLWKDFEGRDVPGRIEILRIFFGGRGLV